MPRFRPLSLIAALTLVACGGGDAPDNAPPATMAEAMEQAAQAIQGQSDGAEPVSAAELQKRLPETVDGLPRVDVKRQESGAMGMKVSNTVARYEGEGGRHMTIAITDIGGMGGVGAMGMAAWAMTDFDRTTTSGFERTTRFDGFKAMESLSQSGGNTNVELNIMVGERFIVQLEGRNVELDALKDGARSLDLRALARAK